MWREQPLLSSNSSDPYLPRAAVSTNRHTISILRHTCIKSSISRTNTHLLSLRILKTFRLSISRAVRSGLTLRLAAAPIALIGNAPRQRSWRSARPSFVPSASTTTVPYQPGSTSHAPPGPGPGPTNFGTEMRSGFPPEGGRIVNDERCTQRTTM